MILYTPLPMEMIFQEHDANFPKQETIEIEGGLLLVEPVSDNQYKIVRLISSDPQLYLKQQYAPGEIITMTWQL